MRAVIAAGALCVLAGCVADVDMGGEDVGEAVAPTTLRQCQHACVLGGAYFTAQFCSKQGTLAGIVCVVAARSSVYSCKDKCEENMPEHVCVSDCCDAEADELEQWCRTSVSVPKNK